MSALDKEWQVWLDDNLARGCDVAELYGLLRTNGFAVETIKRMMGNAYPVGIDAQEAPPVLDYKALSETLETNHARKLGIQRFDTSLIQLYTLKNFMTPGECKRVIALAEAQLRPSEVTHSNGDYAFRTSETCDLNSQNNVFIKHIDEKIARALGVCLPYSEPIQAQRYDVGQEFKAHHDYFAPNTDIYQKFAGNLGQRTWTFMVYLNATPKGGGTYFPYLEHTFYPRQGMAVIWNNLYPDGTPNRNTLHHGMPVDEGKKVIITKWFREKGYGPMFYSDVKG
jgi:prolyl 4-hydroxylase